MNGPFRTPAAMPRAPIPHFGHREWHPRPELLGALDIGDRLDLDRTLSDARNERFFARMYAFTSFASIAITLWAIARLAEGVERPADVVFGVVLCAIQFAFYAWASRVRWRRACWLRSAAFHKAERALEAKLARDERPAALRAITNLDVIERALLGGISGGAA
ncbi:MAG: hypothetical protein MUE69_33110 [Myxococcota bacterium]|nr:hypothetical protein [Myxococcota bacterium]